MQNGSQAAAQDAPLRAIIWHAATGELPGEMLSSLTRRISKFSFCTDAYSVMAEACLVERQRNAEKRANHPAPVQAVLVLVQPDHLGELGEVLEAIGLYASSTCLWRYDRGANPKLNPVVQEDVQRWIERHQARNGQAAKSAVPTAAAPRRPEPDVIRMPTVQTRPVGLIVPKPVASPAKTTEAPPRMRLVGTDAEPSNGEPNAAKPSNGVAPAPARASKQPRITTQLTEEELRMLLSDEPLDVPPKKRGQGGPGGPAHGPGGGGR